LVEIALFERWVGHSERKFQGVGGRPPTNFGVRKLDSLGYHVVVVRVILRLAILIQYRRVTHRHTHGHAMMAITAQVYSSARVKMVCLVSHLFFRFAF